MNRKGKLENVKAEMKRYGLNVLGLSEVRWKDGGDFESDGYRIVYAGGVECQRGVGVILDGETARRVVSVEAFEDRIIVVKIQGLPVDTVIVQVYMPTSEHLDEEVELLYEQLEEILAKQKGSDNIVMMGDWNAVVGEGREGMEVGEFGLGNRNDRGEKLVEFCQRNKLVVTNTWFQQEKRRRYTWKKPGDTGRFQIDYLLVKQRFRNSVKSSWSYPGADADSDHNLVIMKMNVKLKKLKKGSIQRKWNMDRLKLNEKSFCKDVEENVENGQSSTVEEKWRQLKSAITESAVKNIGYSKGRVAKKPWITTSMLDKMEERRMWKSRNSEEGRKNYRKLNNELRRETEKAKEEWWNNECKELEDLDQRGRSDLVYSKVRKLTESKKSGSRSVSIKDKDGRLLTDPEEIRKRWLEYVELLYDKKGKPEKNSMEVEDEKYVCGDDKGPSVLKSEIMTAIKEMKKNKAVGVDGIPAEFLKSLGENATQELIELCMEMYEQGIWPEDFTKVVMIPLQKKANAVECEDYRTISLISHASKIMLKVLTRRIDYKVKDFLGQNQFGFRKGCGTRDAIGVMRVLCERNLEYGNDVYICFVDFEKAFDRINWVKMMEILKSLKIDWKDRRMITELYMKQEAVIRVANGDSEPGVIGRGVRQGCPLSPLLFSIYAEAMMLEAMEDIEEGVRVGGQLIKDVRFADDQGMVASTEKGLQELMNGLSVCAARYGMKINVKKTKTMVVSRTGGGHVHILVDGQVVEQVKKFKYLGSMITEEGRSIDDVKIRIAMAKVAFNKRKELLTKNMSKAVKKKMVKALVWPVALYGCETWTMKKEERDRLNAFEMWVWRRMEKISWKDRVTNEQVLSRVGEERSLVESIVKRKKNWIGHVVRGNGLLKLVLEGRMDGKRPRGRPRIGMIDELKEGSYVDMKRRAEDRENWRVWMPGTCLRTENL
jgi:exonuclease III